MHAISAQILVSTDYNLNTKAARKELDNIREMIAPEACLEQDIPPLTIFTPNSGTDLPSVVLHAAGNEYPTMDVPTFVDYQRGFDDISDLRILIRPRKEKEKKKHKEGSRCRKCWEAEEASAHFANAMSDGQSEGGGHNCGRCFEAAHAKGPLRNTGEQEPANRFRTIREPEIERPDFVEPEIKRSDLIEPEMKNPDFYIGSLRWWRLHRARRY